MEVVLTKILFDGANMMWYLCAADSLMYFLSSVRHDKQISCGKYGQEGIGDLGTTGIRQRVSLS